MYEKWLADDGDKLRITKAQILDMREKVDSIHSGQTSKDAILSDKEDALAEKEQVLSVPYTIWDCPCDCLIVKRILNFCCSLLTFSCVQCDFIEHFVNWF